MFILFPFWNMEKAEQDTATREMANEMKRKVFGCLITVVVVIALFMGASVWMADSFFNADDQEIKEGFSTELVDGLKSQYGITIPEKANFIKGYTSIGQDSCVAVLFECPLDHFIIDSELDSYIINLLKLDKDTYGNYSVTCIDSSVIFLKKPAVILLTVNLGTVTYRLHRSISHRMTENC